jgi:predicted Zn-ribbon and HTH transcriptional regulator
MSLPKYGIRDLALEYGYDDVLDLLEEYGMDSICPGICRNCGYVDDVEPDADYVCHECGKGRMQSAMILVGVV